MLKEAYIAVAGKLPTAVQNLEGIQKSNFVVSSSGTESNLEDYTLDGDGNVIGLFVGRVNVSYGISGADTDINVVVNCHNDFGDNTSKDPVLELVRSKDVAADPIGDNFTVENVMATEVVIDGATNGDFSLHFDGYIIPVVPLGAITEGEDIPFGDVVENETSVIPTSVSASRLSGNLVIAAAGAFTVSLEEMGVYGPSVEIAPDSDGNIEETFVYVKFSPVAVTNYSEDLTFESAGSFTKTLALTGAGVSA